MSNVALPFLVLPDTAVPDHEFLIGPAGTPLPPASDLLQGWDYAQDLEVIARASIDMALASESLGIPLSGLRLCAVLHAGTGAGSLPRRTWELARHCITDEDPEIKLDGSIAGGYLSARLRLDLQILLAAPASTSSPLSPSLPGSRLWSSQQDVLLEDGGDSRFPIELSSFSHTMAGQPHAGAPWYVDWRPYAMEADFGGAVRVYVNSDIEAIATRFVAGDAPTLQAIVADVMTQMISTTLGQEGSEELLEQCEEGSVGQQVRFWLDSAFPGHAHSSISSMMRDRPNVYRATILALATLGDPA